MEVTSEVDSALTAKPIPVALWPAEERINKSLGKGEGLKGVIRMRWATAADVKKKGSEKDSQFYKKYGMDAGKEGYRETPVGANENHPQKRRRGEIDTQVVKARLDDELDAFLAEDEVEDTQPFSPPSKMRSDYLGVNGRTLLERTSVIRARPDALESRLAVADNGRETRRLPAERRGQRSGRRGERDERGGRERTERGKKTAQDLDAELDAFLNSKD